LSKEREYELIWTAKAQKGYDSLHPRDQKRVDKAIRDFKSWIESGRGKKPDVKRLRASPDVIRLRVGKVRVLMRYIPTEPEITVLNIGYRGDVYKK